MKRRLITLDGSATTGVVAIPCPAGSTIEVLGVFATLPGGAADGEQAIAAIAQPGAADYRMAVSILGLTTRIVWGKGLSVTPLYFDAGTFVQEGTVINGELPCVVWPYAVNVVVISPVGLSSLTALYELNET